MRDLRAVDRTLAAEAKRNIRKAEKRGQQAVTASAAAAKMFEAARAVKPANRFTGKNASLGLKVDARIAPNARPLDHPNEGAFNRHRVFGRNVWVNQPARPFFNRGANAAFDACENEMEAALGAVVRILGRG